MFKSVKFWLAISLCLNLFFVGLLAGGAFHGRKLKRDMPGPQNEIGAIFRALPKEARSDIMGKVRSHNPPPRKYDIEELAELIDHEPFDAETVRVYLERGREHNDQRIVAAQSALLLSIEELSDEERDLMAEKLRNMPHRKPKH